MPLTRLAQARIPALSGLYLASAAYLVTFLFCGFWHGSTGNFLVWGLYHGLGLAAYDVYRQRRLLAFRRVGQALPRPTTRGRLLFVPATFLFVSLGWVFFTLPLSFWLE